MHHASTEPVFKGTAGRNRVVIEGVQPEVDSGRFPIKRIVGDTVIVEADVFADGHDRVFCQLLYRKDETEAQDDAREWSTAPMEPLGNDRWRGEFLVSSVGRYRYVLEGWTDPRFVTRGRELSVIVDREKARFSTWYELFPRSCAPKPGRHGTFRDCEVWLPHIADMGFDVLYFPPIHPIGQTMRKGKNSSSSGANEVGSPWAIGSEEGGHKSIHPELGTPQDFRRLVRKAKDFGLEIALDIAFQCSPDHPYVIEHPEFFRKRPDGSIAHAENPPKKYPDIYPFDFESPAWEELWVELRSIIVFWIEQGVEIFRVDNPHTKAFAFWEWALGSIKEQYPHVLFLSEAFTRPRSMYRLAKLGFSQSYTYFAWRNSKQELTDYFQELTQTDIREYFRPNLWPNTPDILTDFLQHGGRPAFMIRLVLAATLGANYGIYGPAFELCVNIPREPGSEEYLDSEKYEIRHWNLSATWSLKEYISDINRIRRANPALQTDRTLKFHHTDNPMLICYSKVSEDRSNAIVVVVNLDPFWKQAGWVTLDLDSLGLDPVGEFQAMDLLGGGDYLWQGPRNYVELTPESLPAHVLSVQRLGPPA